jgi:GntR family transcriptional regulator/MocR family aminotransferase
MRLRYRRRRDLLNEVLDELGLSQIAGVAAGLQALVELPADGPSEDEVVELAAREGLALEGAGKHWHGRQALNPSLLIGFAHPSEQAYPAALFLLKGVLQRALG